MSMPPETPEIENDLELEEKRPLISDIESLAVKTDVSPEGVAPESPAPAQESAPTVTAKKSPKRLHSFDNLRTVLIFLLVLEHAVLETIAQIPKYSDEKFPKQLLFLTLFVTLTRHTVVGLLFFVSGIASFESFGKTGLERLPLLRVLCKTLKTSMYVGAYYYTMQWIQCLYVPGPEEGQGVSFFALRAGNSFILTGPIYYVVLLLAFDWTYMIARIINLRFKVYKRFITTKGRFNLARIIAIGVLQTWSSLVAADILHPPAIIVPYLPSFADAYLPMQYILAYMAGIHFVSYYRISLVETPIRYSIYVFSYRLYLVSAFLFALYRYLPSQMHGLSNLTAAPNYVLKQSKSSPTAFFLDAALFYGAWNTLVFFNLASAAVQLFCTNNRLMKDWGLISKVAFFQPFIHMLFVMYFARTTAWIENLIWRCVFVGVTSGMCGWFLGMVPVLLWRLLGLGKGFSLSDCPMFFVFGLALTLRAIINVVVRIVGLSPVTFSWFLGDDAGGHPDPTLPTHT